VAARVAELWRYPVKSMLGERLTECEVGVAGMRGDRAFGVVDAADGLVASAKHPHKWSVLLRCRATTVDDGVVEITLPDGSSVRSDDDRVDAVLSALVGRDVHLASTAPDERAFEEVWPDIDGLAPEGVIAGTNVGVDASGERVSRFPLGSGAPAGTFFDLAVLHLLTTATLARLRELAPEATFDVRRYRPNVLVDTGDGAGFPENDWAGRAGRVGSVGITMTIPTMRCVMTTLAQDELPVDRATLRTIAAGNRVEIPGWGTWACAGVYAGVDAPGTVRVGDAVEVAQP
jgi:uncharacterized protein YcbX